MRRSLLAAVLSIVLAGCALVPGAHDREEGRVVGARLRAAGFRALPADTPEKAAHLETMPRLLFTSVVRKGERRWLFADPDDCRCLYVGDDAAYQRYTAVEVGGEIAPSARAARLEDSDAQAVDHGMEYLGPWEAQAIFPFGTQP